MNRWQIKKSLTAIAIIQVTLLVLIVLESLNFHIPILRQFIGFIYLTFIPGILILRILKLHYLDNIETILYSVGLSLTTLMFTGFFMNTVYPFFGVSKPLSEFSFIITLSILVFLLCILSYVRDRDFSNPTFINFENLSCPPALFLLLIPFLSIFGTYLFNFYNNNILLLVLLATVAMIVILIGFDILIPKNLYALTVFVISISLLYHRSLISTYLWGYDIHIEYYLANLVKINSFWDSGISHNYNAMLSVTMLGPVFSSICNLSIIWVFKIIYPLLFSLVPLGLYRVFQEVTDDKIAFLSSFFFMAVPTFYGSMIQLARQQIAELFLVLLILLMVDKGINKNKRSTLFLIFGFSLVVSHYGISYIYLFSLFSLYPILFLMENQLIQDIKDSLYRRFSNSKNNSLEERNITPRFILLFTIFTITWYMSFSGSSVFYAIIRIIDRIAINLFTQFLNLEATQGLKLILMELASPLHEVNRIFHLLSQFFIVIGVLAPSLNLINVNFGKEYKTFSLINSGFLFAAIAVPYFSISLQTARLYHITLFFLAPFCVIGGIVIFNIINGILGNKFGEKNMKDSLKLLSLFFAIFLLFTSGFFYEVTNDIPRSISLDKDMDFPRFNDKEVRAAKWLSDVKGSNLIFADFYGVQLINGFDFNQVKPFVAKKEKLSSGTYIYLRSLNLKGLIVEKNMAFRIYAELLDSAFYNQVIIKKNKIYDNGGSEIYR